MRTAGSFTQHKDHQVSEAHETRRAFMIRAQERRPGSRMYGRDMPVFGWGFTGRLSCKGGDRACRWCCYRTIHHLDMSFEPIFLGYGFRAHLVPKAMYAMVDSLKCNLSETRSSRLCGSGTQC